MRFAIPLGLVLTVGHVGASPLLQARHEPTTAAPLIPVRKALNIETVKATIPRDGIKAIKMRHGPFKLAVAGVNQPLQGGSMASMDSGGTTFSYRADTDFPKDITVLYSKTHLVFEDGSPANVAKGVYNHHTTFTVPSKKVRPALGCEKNNLTSGSNAAFVASAEEGGAAEFTTLDGKFNSGSYVGKDDTVLILGDVVNYNKEEKEVYMLTVMEYVPGKPANLMDSALQLIELGQCDGTDALLHPPPGKLKWSLEGPDMIVLQDGAFVSSRGHLHDGGVNLIVKLNGKVACESKAVYGGEGKTTKGADGKEWTTIGSMTNCPAPIKLVKGDKIRFLANYDFEKHPSRVQASGEHAEEMASLVAYYAIQP